MVSTFSHPQSPAPMFDIYTVSATEGHVVQSPLLTTVADPTHRLCGIFFNGHF